MLPDKLENEGLSRQSEYEISSFIHAGLWFLFLVLVAISLTSFVLLKANTRINEIGIRARIP